MQNVKNAYEGAGNEERFSEIRRRVKEADLRGTVLCEELQNDGWTAVFYSPRTVEDLAESGEREKLDALNTAKAGARIWKSPVPGSQGVRCEAVITGYRGVVPDSHTEALLEKLENAPFFVGVANGGIHTFVGHKGNVCDFHYFHWTAQPDDKSAMTENPIRSGNGTPDSTWFAGVLVNCRESGDRIQTHAYFSDILAAGRLYCLRPGLRLHSN